jgi:glycosyltransferase involved in cell wall biosynthesis
MHIINMVKVSVVVPVYNVEAYLKECVDSLLAQTLKEIEIILVDDGSPDGCPEICDNYAQRYDNVIVIHQNNSGLSEARNAGIGIANGEYIGFVDSDDYVDNDMFEQLYVNAINEDADVVKGSQYLLKSDGAYSIRQSTRKVDKAIPGGKKGVHYFYKNGVSVNVVDAIYRKSLFDHFRFPKGLINEDHYFTPRAYFYANKIAHVHRPFYWHRTRPDSIMTSYSLRRLDFLQVMKLNKVFLVNNNIYSENSLILDNKIANSAIKNIKLATKHLNKNDYRKFRKKLCSEISKKFLVKSIIRKKRMSIKDRVIVGIWLISPTFSRLIIKFSHLVK